MTQLSDTELWEYIREDLPYFDLTTHLLEVSSQELILSVITRDEIVVACVEEASRIAQLLGCEVLFAQKSGVLLQKDETLLEIRGDYQLIHQAWRACQMLLEHACGLATQAHKMLQKARGVNKHCEVFVTRKSFPFAKRFSIRALLCGGVLPHRLGLSESLLIFPQHRALYKDEKSFEEAMLELKMRCVEKKLIIESHNVDDAKKMIKLGADVIQADKWSIERLKELVTYKNEHFPHVKVVAAGGVNVLNVAEFVETGVDAVVTSSLYNSKMADLTSKIKGA